MPRPIGAVDQEDVLPAISVVVEEGTPRAKRLRQQLAAIGAVVVPERESGGGCDVGKLKPGRRRGLTADADRERRQAQPRAAAAKEVAAIDRHSGFTRPCWSA